MLNNFRGAAASSRASLRTPRGGCNPSFMPLYLRCLAALALTGTSLAQTRPTMDFEKYDPVSTLVVPEHKLTRAKFPFINVHNHQWSMPTQNLSTLITEMDKLNMKVMVNLSGQSGNNIINSVKNIKDNYPKRFIVFANV